MWRLARSLVVAVIAAVVTILTAAAAWGAAAYDDSAYTYDIDTNSQLAASNPYVASIRCEVVVEGPVCPSAQSSEHVYDFSSSFVAPNAALPRFEGPKPSYDVNPAHVPGQGLRRSNPKTPLPNDAESVFKKAVPDDAMDPTNWFGLNADGQIYRFSGDAGRGTAHFSGIDGVGDGIQNLTPYARDRLAALGGGL